MAGPKATLRPGWATKPSASRLPSTFGVERCARSRGHGCRRGRSAPPAHARTRPRCRPSTSSTSAASSTCAPLALARCATCWQPSLSSGSSRTARGSWLKASTPAALPRRGGASGRATQARPATRPTATGAGTAARTTPRAAGVRTPMAGTSGPGHRPTAAGRRGSHAGTVTGRGTDGSSGSPASIDHGCSCRCHQVDVAES
mmetsp:Transcript_13623/g.44508  ORF Transcript_13623/g.44508 Transcript_13623/m.44508 type:complete len:202 (+) Transcript_13623:608-1213(+)